MRLLKRLIELLSSKEFLLYLTGGWIIYYLTSATWGKEAFANFVLGLDKNLLIQAFYILFLSGLYLNFVRVVIKLFRKDKRYLLMWLPLSLGIIIFLTVFFVSINIRHMGRLLVGEGVVVAPPWEASRYIVSAVMPALREETLEGEAESRIFAHEPKIVLTDEMQNHFDVGVYPPKKIRSTYYHILNFGLAPGVRLIEDNNIKAEGYMPLRILPPGKNDFFEIPPYPYRFSIKLMPEKIIEKQGLSTKSYSLRLPTYEVRILRGDRIIFEGNSKDMISFDNFELSFFEPSYWVLLEVVKDPSVLLFLLGLGLIIIGIPLRILSIVLRR